jgi:hypothetical protein
MQVYYFQWKTMCNSCREQLLTGEVLWLIQNCSLHGPHSVIVSVQLFWWGIFCKYVWTVLQMVQFLHMCQCSTSDGTGSINVFQCTASDGTGPIIGQDVISLYTFLAWVNILFLYCKPMRTHSLNMFLSVLGCGSRSWNTFQPTLFPLLLANNFLPHDFLILWRI